MDQRQAQIRERAGLEESKLNEDFIEFLRKYGFWLLVIAALAGGGTTAKRWYAQFKEKQVNAAFSDLEAARAGGEASPEALAGVAADHRNVRSVALLARLEAADAYLRGVRKGLKAGAKVDPDGKLENPDDLMSDADRESYLSRAAEMYQGVLDSTGRNSAHLMIRVSALFGLASVAESRREFEKAQAFYEQVADLVKGTTFAPQGSVARARIAYLSTLSNMPLLVTRADLPDLPPEDAPLVPIQPESGETPQLNLEPVQMVPGGNSAVPSAIPVIPDSSAPSDVPASDPEPSKIEPDQPASPK